MMDVNEGFRMPFVIQENDDDDCLMRPPGTFGTYSQDLDLSKIQELPSGLHTENDDNTPKMT